MEQYGVEWIIMLRVDRLFIHIESFIIDKNPKGVRRFHNLLEYSKTAKNSMSVSKKCHVWDLDIYPSLKCQCFLAWESTYVGAL